MMCASKRALCLMLILCMALTLTVGGCAAKDEGQQSSLSQAPAADFTAGYPTYSQPEETLVSNGDCEVRILGVTEDRWELAVHVACRNKTLTRTLVYTVEDFCINGYLLQPLWTEELKPLASAESKISFMTKPAESIGAPMADEVSFLLRVYDAKKGGEDLVRETFVLYPTGLTPDQVVYPERRTEAGEQVMVNDDGLTFIVLSSESDDLWSFTLHCYLENKTDHPVLLGMTDVTVDGRAEDPIWAKRIPTGARRYESIYIPRDRADAAVPVQLGFTLHLYDDTEAFSLEGTVYEDLSYGR